MEQRVLFTASVYRHIQNFHLPYIEAFRAAGWQVHVACANAPAQIPGADLAAALPFTKRMSAPENFAAARTLRRMIRQNRYGLIVTHTALAAFFTRLAVKGLPHRPRLVNMVHGYLFDDTTAGLKKGLLTGAEALTRPETDLLLAMNRWDYEYARAHRLGRQVELVPGIGVDFARLDCPEPGRGGALRRELGIPEEAFVVLYAAEFSARKDQATLLRALTLLPPWIVLLLPGEGELLEDCRALAKELGVADRVRFPGHVDGMSGWYAAADGAVSASRSEGLPFNLMEAMYLGLPVAATRVKGHTDLLGDMGLYFSPGAAQECADQILALAQNPELRRKLAARNRAEVEQYALDRVLPQIMAYYLEDLLFLERRRALQVKSRQNELL